ncbi:hypothetical protein WKT22_03912 [Candidatus Lokiarchaeum ossiferum]
MQEMTKQNLVLFKKKNASHLFEGKIKEMEGVLVEFFQTISDDAGDKATIIFSFIQIHGKLTQQELRDLTKFSFSTISTSLNFLVNVGSIVKNFIPGTHKYEYFLKKNHVLFIYKPFSSLLEEWENYEQILIQYKKHLMNLKEDHPIQAEFLIRRINGYLNFVECQRRSIDGRKRNDFFPEYTLNLLNNKSLIEFSPKIANIEQKMYEYRESCLSEKKTLNNKIIGYFYFRRNLTQQRLVQLTQNSLSAISKSLKELEKTGVIKKFPKNSSKKQSIYSLEYRSLTNLNIIIAADTRIYSYYIKFCDMLNELQDPTTNLGNLTGYSVIKNKLEEIVKAINEFRSNTEFVKKTKKELEEFILQAR